MKKQNNSTPSLADVEIRASAEATLSGSTKKGLLARLIPFLGPAFIASVAYVDPGNFATNIQSGSQFGYTLLWVIVASNLMAVLIQTLSAKLGIATGKNLAEHCRDQFPRPVAYIMWFLMELVAMATDLAEFLGAALGFNLLFGIPLIWGGVLAAIATFLILGLERYGFRPLEAVIAGMVSVIAVCYLIQSILDKPDWGQVVYHSFVPQFQGTESIILATGILGATVMPHAIFLHSALTQGRIVVKDPDKLKKLFRFEIVDVAFAMSIASLVNMAILIMAASTFFKEGLTHIASIEEAHLTLQPLLGHAAGWIFAISLLASGLSSSSVGTSAGQVIMQGFLHWHIPVWLRRLITIFPSLIVIAWGLDPTRTLVISQVVLSFGLPFAIIPLVMFTSSKKIMGILVNKKFTSIIASIIAFLIVALNLFLLYQIFFG
ncbi:MAG: Nramp family divalent metal transporter [Bacillota bacterium]